MRGDSPSVAPDDKILVNRIVYLYAQTYSSCAYGQTNIPSDSP